MNVMYKRKPNMPQEENKMNFTTPYLPPEVRYQNMLNIIKNLKKNNKKSKQQN